MNILIISYHPIYPFNNGASIAQFGIIEYLSKQCNISLLLPQWHTITDEDFNELKKLLPNIKLYAVSEQSTLNAKSNEINTSAKLLNLIRNFKNNLQFLLRSIDIKNSSVTATPEEKFARELYPSRYYVYNQEYVEKINEIIWQDEIDIVQLEFIETLSLVATIPPNIKKIFIQHESGITRIKSHIDANQINSCYADYILKIAQSIEVSLLKEFNAIVSFSEYENSILQAALKATKNNIIFFVSPYAIHENQFKDIDMEKFSPPRKLIFIGTEIHFPNKDAVEWFLEETAEEVFNKFGLELHVVGNWSLNTIRKYQKHPSRVKFLGFVDDLYEVAKDSISIVPVRIGGGLRTKIMLSMAQGIPVICTEYALQGITASHLESVLIAEDKNSFCWAIEYLLADLERTFMICHNAQNLIKNNYSQSVVSKQRYKIYQNF
ncbi:MAG: glycosyltransferase family 4 protein [Goleter apudmare HA4340-LM2]|jgi:glycosyltransferase involved in cell wall biosynthesis|nr:glycosyltransferase family 4 protein [Goleter apudmare HA4340-LM2]